MHGRTCCRHVVLEFTCEWPQTGHGGFMLRLFPGLLILLLAWPDLHAQSVTYPPAERQIAAAVSPLPAALQAGAKVLGYNAQGKLVTLRAGTNEMICVADDPAG